MMTQTKGELAEFFRVLEQTTTGEQQLRQQKDGMKVRGIKVNDQWVKGVVIKVQQRYQGSLIATTKLLGQEQESGAREEGAWGLLNKRPSGRAETDG